MPVAYLVAVYWRRWRIEDAFAIVNRLLGLAYLWAGSQNAVEVHVWATLTGPTRCAVTRVSPSLQLREIASQVFMPAYLPCVEIDIDKIDRVLINLLDNAIKFTPSSGLISVKAEAQGAHIAVSINDNSCGIPLEQRDQIFERFARGSNGSGALVRGFGLGLTFCRLAVEAHGGKIWIEDGDGGVGCKSIFTLPLEREA